MTESIKDIIQQLEHQRTAIERALAALHEIDGVSLTNGTGSLPRLGTKTGGMTPEGRKRLSESLKRRWAVKRAASGVQPAKRKGGITPEGRKRLSDALRKRWAVKRAASGSRARSASKR